MSVGLVYQLCCTTARPVHRSPGHQHRATVADGARLVDEHGTRCWFTSRILPPNLRRSPKVAEGLRCCTRAGCRRGLPPGVDGLLSEEAAGLSATNIAWLTAVWEVEYQQFQAQPGGLRLRVRVGGRGALQRFDMRLEDARRRSTACVSFEEVLSAMAHGGLLDVLDHPLFIAFVVSGPVSEPAHVGSSNSWLRLSGAFCRDRERGLPENDHSESEGHSKVSGRGRLKWIKKASLKRRS